jgi:hypothetical protein
VESLRSGVLKDVRKRVCASESVWCEKVGVVCDVRVVRVVCAARVVGACGVVCKC